MKRSLKKSILTLAESRSLAVARDKRDSKEVHVRAHDRAMRFGMLPKFKQLARWEKVHSICLSIAADSDVFEVTSDDRRHAARLIQLLDDTFMQK